ncbi:MAG: peptidoglycan-binding protein, partial [Alphaproteobacteria bacterium]|nr:peptidoglycan-binding protein [Alphaproteobacteria bacterium]
MTMLELKDERPNRSGGWFKLKRPVGRGQPNEREDVIKVETVLGNAGHFDLEGLDGPTGYLGTLLDEGIRAFQAGNGLKTDGILNPDGPTLSMAKRRLGGKLDPYTPPTLGQVEDHHQRLKRGEAGLLLHRPPAPVLRPIPGLPEVDGGVYVMNRRSADYLLRHLASDGEHARWTAADIADRGPAGVARARDLLDQIRERDPERADTYASGILAHLTDDAHKRAFLGGDPPAPRPLGILAAEAQEKPAAAPAGNAEAKHATTTFPAPTPIAPPPPAKEEAKTPEPPKTPEPQGGGGSDEQ